MIKQQLFLAAAMIVLGSIAVYGQDSIYKQIFDAGAAVMDPEKMLDLLKVEAAQLAQMPDGDLTDDDYTKRGVIDLFIEQADVEHCDTSEIDQLIDETDAAKWPNLVGYLEYFREKQLHTCK